MRGLINQNRKRIILRWLYGLIGLVLLLTVYREIAFQIFVPKVFSERSNGIWLRYQWLGEEHTPAQYKALAKRLKDLGIGDAFVHAGPICADGSIEPRKIRYARDFICNMKKILPHVRFQVWMAGVESGAGGSVALSSVLMRKSVIKNAAQFLDMGFDGIHYDIEPVYSGDSDFIKLLRETHRLTLRHKVILSVAACEPEPVPGVQRAARAVAKYPGYWTREYFLRVAREVDQVEVMCYDSGMPLPSLYGNSIAATVKLAVDNGVDDILIGIPTYSQGSAAHMEWVENPKNALISLKREINKLAARDRRKVGAAIYAEWTTSAEDELVWKSMWLAEIN